MVGLVKFLTHTEILLESNTLGLLIACYVFLFSILFVSFVNIYSVDKYEFLNNMQNCIEFKKKVFFIVHYSKHRYVVSLKTFILEAIGYALAISIIIGLLFSLKLEISYSLVLVAVLAFIILVFGCITGAMYRKAKNRK